MWDPVVLSSFEEYRAGAGDSPEMRAREECERNEMLARFPHALMLLVGYDELDLANQWCWQQVGPADGDCLDRHSKYRVWELTEPHAHAGKWMWNFWGKDGYDYGFCEWYFVEQSDCEGFLAYMKSEYTL